MAHRRARAPHFRRGIFFSPIAETTESYSSWIAMSVPEEK